MNNWSVNLFHDVHVLLLDCVLSPHWFSRVTSPPLCLVVGCVWRRRICRDDRDVNRKSIYQLTCEHSKMFNTNFFLSNIYYMRHETSYERGAHMNSSTRLCNASIHWCVKNCNSMKNRSATNIFPSDSGGRETLWIASNQSAMKNYLVNPLKDSAMGRRIKFIHLLPSRCAKASQMFAGNSRWRWAVRKSFDLCWVGNINFCSELWDDFSIECSEQLSKRLFAVQCKHIKGIEFSRDFPSLNFLVYWVREILRKLQNNSCANIFHCCDICSCDASHVYWKL